MTVGDNQRLLRLATKTAFAPNAGTMSDNASKAACTALYTLLILGVSIPVIVFCSILLHAPPGPAPTIDPWPRPGPTGCPSPSRSDLTKQIVFCSLVVGFVVLCCIVVLFQPDYLGQHPAAQDGDGLRPGIIGCAILIAILMCAGVFSAGSFVTGEDCSNYTSVTKGWHGVVQAAQYFSILLCCCACMSLHYYPKERPPYQPPLDPEPRPTRVVEEIHFIAEITIKGG